MKPIFVMPARAVTASKVYKLVRETLTAKKLFSYLIHDNKTGLNIFDGAMTAQASLDKLAVDAQQF